MTESKPIATVRETAAEWGLDPCHLYRLIDAGVIPQGVAIALGRRKFLHREKFREWVEAGGGSYEGGWKRQAEAAAGR